VIHYREEFLKEIKDGIAKCALCGGFGPFKTQEQVLRETKGKYTWDNVCIACREAKVTA
jgi:hypothetical protein